MPVVPKSFSYAYMKKDNKASCATACANAMRLLREFTDVEGEQTLVYGITRAQWKAGLTRA